MNFNIWYDQIVGQPVQTGQR